MKNITLRQLRVFAEVARHLSLVRAAERLHLTPPARFDCIADLRVRFADGRVEEHAREDLCQAQRVLRVPSAPR